MKLVLLIFMPVATALILMGAIATGTATVPKAPPVNPTLKDVYEELQELKALVKEIKSCECPVQSKESAKPETQSNVEVLFFTADWCRYCPPVKASLQSAIVASKVRVIDCTSSNALALQYGVKGYPTVALIKDGRLVKSTNSPITESTVDEWLME